MIDRHSHLTSFKIMLSGKGWSIKYRNDHIMVPVRLHDLMTMSLNIDVLRKAFQNKKWHISAEICRISYFWQILVFIEQLFKNYGRLVGYSLYLFLEIMVCSKTVTDLLYLFSEFVKKYCIFWENKIWRSIFLWRNV